MKPLGPDLVAPWRAAWPAALAAWSRYTQLRPPALHTNSAEAAQAGLAGSFAMIRLRDQQIVIDLARTQADDVAEFAVEILAHEIGHHVLAPATLTDHARCLLRMRRSLPTIEDQAPLVANLYTDLLINDRLQRSADLRMAEIYQRLHVGDLAKQNRSVVWRLYMRIYELLWSLPRDSLGGGGLDDAAEGDAWLGMRLVRAYAADWLGAAGSFACLLLPHLLADKKAAEIAFKCWLDTRSAGADALPEGLLDEDAATGPAIHPSQDPRVNDLAPISTADTSTGAPALPPPDLPRARGQALQPFEYLEILRAAGWPGDERDAVIAYYLELAERHTVRYPRLPARAAIDPLPEGLAPWEMGDPLDACDWFQTVLQSPRVVPGLTTVQRVYGDSPGREPRREPIDLDLYVDSSGSMPDPAHTLSYPALAGAIIVRAALRAGARVQATLWSGKHQFQTTPGFIRDESALLRVLTAHYGGGTQFPLHVLRDTTGQRPAHARPVHILSISDDGVTTMFEDEDELAHPGWTVCARALAHARAGGTLALNIPETWATLSCAATLRRAQAEQNWTIHAVPTLEGLVAFARAFSRQRFGPAAATADVRR
jgi:hypothetical protein